MLCRDVNLMQQAKCFGGCWWVGAESMEIETSWNDISVLHSICLFTSFSSGVSMLESIFKWSGHVQEKSLSSKVTQAWQHRSFTW